MTPPFRLPVVTARTGRNRRNKTGGGAAQSGPPRHLVNPCEARRYRAS